MKFVKTMKYKIKHLIPMAAIAGATLLPAACNKTRHAPEEPHHNTTYVWGENDWSQIWPADKVAASADSTLVDYVFLHNNGASMEGKSTTRLMEQLNMILAEIPANKRHKIRGSGTLNDMGITNDQHWQDSLNLAKMGFKFGLVHYNGYKHK